MNRITISLLVLSIACTAAAEIGDVVLESSDSRTARQFFNNNATLVTVGIIPFAFGVALSLGLLLLLFVPFLYQYQGTSGYDDFGYADESSYLNYGRKVWVPQSTTTKEDAKQSNLYRYKLD